MESRAIIADLNGVLTIPVKFIIIAIVGAALPYEFCAQLRLLLWVEFTEQRELRVGSGPPPIPLRVVSAVQDPRVHGHSHLVRERAEHWSGDGLASLVDTLAIDAYLVVWRRAILAILDGSVGRDGVEKNLDTICLGLQLLKNGVKLLETLWKLLELWARQGLVVLQFDVRKICNCLDFPTNSFFERDQKFVHSFRQKAFLPFLLQDYYLLLELLIESYLTPERKVYLTHLEAALSQVFKVFHYCYFLFNCLYFVFNLFVQQFLRIFRDVLGDIIGSCIIDLWFVSRPFRRQIAYLDFLIISRSRHWIHFLYFINF